MYLDSGTLVEEHYFMDKTTRLRSLSALLMVVFIVVLNTLVQLSGYYSGWLALAIYAVAALLVFVTLRFQRRLSPVATAALLAVPFALVALGALVST